MKRVFLSLFVALCAMLPSLASAQATVTGTLAQPTQQQAVAVWVSESTKGRVGFDEAHRYVTEAYNLGKRHAVDPLLILSVMRAESGFNVNAKNRSGARGLLQVIPKYHQDKIQRRNIMDYKVNMDVGTQIIHEYLVWHKENYHGAMKRYSGGASAAYGSKIQKTYRELRDAVWQWRMAYNQPLKGEHKFGAPRHYSETAVAYQQYQDRRQQQIRDEKALERLLAQHALLDAAYQTAIVH